MKGWTLAYVRSLDVDEFEEIVAWLQDEAKQASGDDSIDMDAYVAAKVAKNLARDSEDDEQ